MTHPATTPPTPTERQAALAAGSPLFVHSEPQEVFERAIRAGRLSHDAKSPIFAGQFMYIGSTMGTHRDLFKHIDSKLYLPDEDTEQWARDCKAATSMLDEIDVHCTGTRDLEWLRRSAEKAGYSDDVVTLTAELERRVAP